MKVTNSSNVTPLLAPLTLARPFLVLLSLAAASCNKDTKVDSSVNDSYNTQNNTYRSDIVGPKGARVNGSHGASVTIPAGALSEDVEITIGWIRDGSTPALPRSIKPKGEIYSFEPHGLMFDLPVTIGIPHEGDGDDVSLMRAEPNGTWEYVDILARTDSTLRRSALTFSYYIAVEGTKSAVRAEPDAGSPEGSPSSDPEDADDSNADDSPTDDSNTDEPPTDDSPTDDSNTDEPPPDDSLSDEPPPDDEFELTDDSDTDEGRDAGSSSLPPAVDPPGIQCVESNSESEDSCNAERECYDGDERRFQNSGCYQWLNGRWKCDCFSTDGNQPDRSRNWLLNGISSVDACQFMLDACETDFFSGSGECIVDLGDGVTVWNYDECGVSCGNNDCPYGQCDDSTGAMQCVCGPGYSGSDTCVCPAGAEDGASCSSELANWWVACNAGSSQCRCEEFADGWLWKCRECPDELPVHEQPPGLVTCSLGEQHCSYDDTAWGNVDCTCDGRREWRCASQCPISEPEPETPCTADLRADCTYGNRSCVCLNHEPYWECYECPLNRPLDGSMCELSLAATACDYGTYRCFCDQSGTGGDPGIGSWTCQ